MRIRTIKPEFFLHEELAELDAETRLAFIGLWCAADRKGRFEWRPKKLKAQILPYSETDFSRVLDALVTRGLLVKYASSDREFGWIPGFTKHQVINNRERGSEIPPAPEDACINNSDATGTRGERVNDATRSCTSGTGNKEQGTRNREGSTPCSPPEGDGQAEALPDLASDGSDLGELRRRLCAMFGHSGSLPKDGKVNKAWKALVGRCAITEADVELLEFWYAQKKNPPARLKRRYWVRTSVLTLLRNWERDLAFVRELCDEIGGPERADEEWVDEDDDQAARRAVAAGGVEVYERKARPNPEPVPAWPDRSESEEGNDG